MLSLPTLLLLIDKVSKVSHYFHNNSKFHGAACILYSFRFAPPPLYGWKATDAGPLATMNLKGKFIAGKFSEIIIIDTDRLRQIITYSTSRVSVFNLLLTE